MANHLESDALYRLTPTAVVLVNDTIVISSLEHKTHVPTSNMHHKALTTILLSVSKVSVRKQQVTNYPYFHRLYDTGCIT
jgi:hypothetical protein